MAALPNCTLLLRSLLFLGAIGGLSVAARALEPESQAGRDGPPSFPVDPAWPKMAKQWHPDFGRDKPREFLSVTTIMDDQTC